MHIGKLFKKLPKKYYLHKFKHLSLDSRRCKPDDIFFSIRGVKKNGNKFINHAIKNGARTIVSDLNFKGKKENILFIKNNNVRKLVSKIASKFYKEIPGNLIAVTGTNGKSSIANFYYQILKHNKSRVASIGTLGIKTNNSNKLTENTTLDPITIHKNLSLIKRKKIINTILEASSHGLKQHRLDGLKFDTTIFTNLSRDHLDYHKTYKDYFNSKLILFNKLTKKKGNIIYDNDISLSKILKKICIKKNLKSLTIGKKNSNLIIKKHEYVENLQKVEIEFKKKKYLFTTNLIGKIQIKNLLFAILAASKSKIKFKKIIKSIGDIKPVEGRMESIGNIKNNSKVILDYAHTPDALKYTLKSIKEQFSHSSISIVFGCGGDRDKDKRPIMGKIANQYCNKIFLTDDNPRYENPKKIRKQIKKKIVRSKLVEIASRKKAIKAAIENLNSGDILLVAGKGHEIYQEHKGKKKIFSDKKYILKEINSKNKKLFKNWKANILNEKCNLGLVNKKLKINKASINSKNIKKNDIFFAIKGPKNDGNNYVDEAIKKGASLAIVNKLGKYNKSKKIKTNNTLRVLTNASKDVRKISSAKFISITGSSGKTSLKDLLSFCLNKLASTTKSTQSFNNKFGVPLSLFNVKKNDKFAVLEVGMDKAREIDELTKIVRPDFGIITNISYAHIKNFKNLTEIAKAKSEIIKNIVEGGKIILNRDDNYFNFLKKIALKKNLHVISFSKKNSLSDIYIKKITSNKINSKIFINIKNATKSFLIKKNLHPYLHNILASVAIISEFYNLKNIDEKLFYNFKLPFSRGDITKTKLKNKVIYLTDESYNSNPLSLKFAIENFDKQNNNNKYLILGDMLELGKFSKILHKKMSKIINKTSIKKVYVIGKHIKETFYAIDRKKRGRILRDKNEIYQLIKNDLNNNDHLMIKASNSTGLNSVAANIKKGKIYAI
jgi:murE/murF fusion protein